MKDTEDKIKMRERWKTEICESPVINSVIRDLTIIHK